MSKAGYSAPAAAVVALTATVAKSVIGVQAPAQFGCDLKKLRLGFDGVTASAIPVQIEICQATFATNPPGTASTAITPVQVYGLAIYDFPLGDTLDSAVSTGFVIRLTAPAAVNVRPTIYFERC